MRSSRIYVLFFFGGRGEERELKRGAGVSYCSECGEGLSLKTKDMLIERDFRFSVLDTCFLIIIIPHTLCVLLYVIFECRIRV